MVVGGMAVIQHGLLRATEDIDLLVRTTPENEARVIDALMYLPDQAVSELKPGDIDEFTVIRVADEIVIDLMKSACGIAYSEAENSIHWIVIDGVRIPFANLNLLWRMKQTYREKDAMDRDFIRAQLDKSQKHEPK